MKTVGTLCSSTTFQVNTRELKANHLNDNHLRAIKKRLPQFRGTGFTIEISNMTKLQTDPDEIDKRVSCVLWYAETRNETSVQRKFSSKFKVKPPHRSTIKTWFDAFIETGNVFARKPGSGRPPNGKELSFEDISPIQPV